MGSAHLTEAWYVKIIVRPYIPNLRRCFKCPKICHTSHTCWGKKTCSKCSSNDHTSENSTSSPLYTNCKGDHPVYSRSCQFWKNETEIMAMTINEKILFLEARQRLSHLFRRSYVVMHMGSITKASDVRVRAKWYGCDPFFPLDRSSVCCSIHPKKPTDSCLTGP